MSKNSLKSLGITVGEPSLIKSVTEHAVAAHDAHQPGRVGIGQNPREVIEKSLGLFHFSEPKQYAKDLDKAGEEELKDTHGEQFHSDAEKPDGKIEEVDHTHAQDDIEFPMHRFMNRVRPDAGARQDAKKSLSRDQLVLKALTDLDRPLAKSEARPAKNEVYEMSVKAKAPKKEPLAKSNPMDDMFSSLRKGLKKPTLIKSDLIVMSEDSNDPEMIKNVHENSDCMVTKKKSDPVPTPPPSGGPNLNPAGVASIKNAFKSTETKKPGAVARQGFLKAMGPGGMVFDFGNLTGNAIADRTTALLNEGGDVVQAQTAKYQADSYNQALMDYAVKGDAAFSQTSSMFGNIDKGWKDQLNKPMDQQVTELYKAEADAKDPSVPAVRNEFNKTEMNVGGEMIKATSETDAAVLEMLKSQGMDLSGQSIGDVADCTAGGAFKVTAGE